MARVSSFVRYLTIVLLALPMRPQPRPQSVPVIGIIDYYGVQKVPLDKIQRALGVVPGDPLPKSKGEVEDRLEEISGIVRARLQAVCCDNGKSILYVGIEQRGAPTFEYRNEPEGDVHLPREITLAFGLFMVEVQNSIRANQTEEDISQGHSLMRFEPARKLQLQFLDLAKKYAAEIKDVLHNSADETERAIAAELTGYLPSKRVAIEDLQFAMKDPDDGVRNNAMRALGVIARLAQKQPDLGLKVSPTWFVEQMNSLIWTDRNKASFALLSLTEDRDPATLALLEERALVSLEEMARWKTLGHALPGFILLGRVAGIAEPRLEDMWKAANYDRDIKAMLQQIRARAKARKK